METSLRRIKKLEIYFWFDLAKIVIFLAIFTSYGCRQPLAWHGFSKNSMYENFLLSFL